MNEDTSTLPADRRWGEVERRQLLVHIEHHWHHTGTSPSYNMLAATYRMNSATIRHHCQQLAKDGYVELLRTEHGKTARGRMVTTVVIHMTVRGREEAYRARWRHAVD